MIGRSLRGEPATEKEGEEVKEGGGEVKEGEGEVKEGEVMEGEQKKEGELNGLVKKIYLNMLHQQLHL